MAVNRIYYGMFYILAALALKYQFKTSKHQGLIGWFIKDFIKDEKIARKYGTMIRDAFNSRSDADYGIMVSFTKEDVLKSFDDMKDFIATIEEYINN
jgi:uncharacterized protein (UPF0332 family)